jgi:hypothetical protein
MLCRQWCVRVIDSHVGLWSQRVWGLTSKRLIARGCRAEWLSFFGDVPDTGFQGAAPDSLMSRALYLTQVIQGRLLTGLAPLGGQGMQLQTALAEGAAHITHTIHPGVFVCFRTGGKQRMCRQRPHQVWCAASLKCCKCRLFLFLHQVWADPSRAMDRQGPLGFCARPCCDVSV